MMKTDFRHEPRYIIILAMLLVAAFFLPNWLRFLLQTALAGGLVSLGVVLQMRAGQVNFGQGLWYCLGGYAVGMLSAKAGITDVALLLPAAVVVALIAGVGMGVMLSRYREIFFAMLSLAVSMILYGLLVKAAWLGSTDGFNIPPVSYFGWLPDRAVRPDVTYAMTASLVILACVIVARYLKSGAGMLCEAVAENEIRLEYLGASSRRVVRIAQAKKLFLEMDLNVADIADMVGFNNENYFCSVFKKYEGKTPVKAREDLLELYYSL